MNTNDAIIELRRMRDENSDQLSKNEAFADAVFECDSVEDFKKLLWWVNPLSISDQWLFESVYSNVRNRSIFTKMLIPLISDTETIRKLVDFIHHEEATFVQKIELFRQIGEKEQCHLYVRKGLLLIYDDLRGGSVEDLCILTNEYINHGMKAESVNLLHEIFTLLDLKNLEVNTRLPFIALLDRISKFASKDAAKYTKNFADLAHLLHDDDIWMLICMIFTREVEIQNKTKARFLAYYIQRLEDMIKNDSSDKGFYFGRILFIARKFVELDEMDNAIKCRDVALKYFHLERECNQYIYDKMLSLQFDLPFIASQFGSWVGDDDFIITFDCCNNDCEGFIPLSDMGFNGDFRSEFYTKGDEIKAKPKIYYLDQIYCYLCGDEDDPDKLHSDLHGPYYFNETDSLYRHSDEFLRYIKENQFRRHIEDVFIPKVNGAD